MWRKLLTLLIVLALAATACGSSTTTADADDIVTGDTPDAAEVQDDSESEEDVAAAEVEDDGDVSLFEEIDSPLFDLLGFDPTSFEDIDYEQAERDRQLLVVECMADQGFEYQVPNYDFDFSFAGPSIDADIEWGTRKYAETYGYGISTFIVDEISSFADQPSPEDFPEDPNQAYLAFLSEGERDAWNAALYGQEPTFFDVVDDEGNPLNPDTGEMYTEDEMQAFWEDYDGGCSSAGYDDGSFLGEDQARITAFYEQFDDLMQDMNERIENDPRVTELTDGWVRCMADKSYTFTDPNDTYTDISARMDPIWDAVYGSGAGFGGGFDIPDLDPEVAEAMTDEELEEFYSDFAPQAPEITPEIQAQIDEINAYEIGVAVADHDCTKPIIAAYVEVQREAEEQFIADNQGAITAFLEEN